MSILLSTTLSTKLEVGGGSEGTGEGQEQRACLSRRERGTEAGLGFLAESKIVNFPC